MTAHPDAPARAAAGLRLVARLRGLHVTAEDGLAILQRASAWWIGELADLLPAHLRERFASPDRRLTLVLEAGGASIVLENGGAPQLLGRLDLDAGADAAAALQTLLQRHNLRTALADGALAVGVRLVPDKALRTIIDLPLAAEGNIEEVISFELDRHTPFRADQAYVSARVDHRDAAIRRIDVELTVVPRPVVDDVVRLADRLGLSLDRVDVAGRSATAPVSGNLLPQTRLAAARRKASRPTYVLAVLAAALAVAAAYVPLVRMQNEAAAAAHRFAAIRAAVALQHEVDMLRQQRLFLVDRKHATVPDSALLLDLTRLLPDDTTLTTLRITGDEVEIGGTARSAAALIDLLERSHRFTDTKFRTPVTQDPATGRETFYIAARIVGGRAS